MGHPDISVLRQRVRDTVVQYLVNARRWLVQEVSAELVERTDSMLRLQEQQILRELAVLRGRLERVERLQRGDHMSAWSPAALLTNAEYLEFTAKNGADLHPVAGRSGKNPVVVLGCADLELLSAMKDSGAQLLPIEPRIELVAAAHARGFAVDARGYRDGLDALPADSVQMIVAARLEDELPAPELRHLLDSASRVLPHGGELWLDLSAAAVAGTDFLLRRAGFPDVQSLGPESGWLVATRRPGRLSDQ